MNDETLTESKAGDRLMMEPGFALGQSHTWSCGGPLLSGPGLWNSPFTRAKGVQTMLRKMGRFFPSYLSMSRAEADRIIHNLDEFGPAYFELSQLTRVSPQTFRAIGPALSDGALHHGKQFRSMPRTRAKWPRLSPRCAAN